MDVSDVICFESDAEVTVRANPVLEQGEQNANIFFPSNDNVTISTDSNLERVVCLLLNYRNCLPL